MILQQSRKKNRRTLLLVKVWNNDLHMLSKTKAVELTNITVHLYFTYISFLRKGFVILRCDEAEHNRIELQKNGTIKKDAALLSLTP